MSLDHTIIWNQLTCTDLDQAIGFYENLFGWTTKPEERETYVHFYLGDQTVAGVMPSHGGPSGPAHWAVHVGTSDIAAYQQRAEAVGGKSLTPIMDIPHTGKLCPIADPLGAVLVAFEPSDPDRKSWGPKQEPGHFCWVELMTGDLPKALQFYGEVVGWKPQVMEVGDIQYTCLTAPGAQDGAAVGGAMTKPEPHIPDHWLPYVAVNSVDAKHAEALKLGARACVPPTVIPGIGKFCVLIDPQDAAIAMYQGQ